jgi:hypothetical protein
MEDGSRLSSRLLGLGSSQLGLGWLAPSSRLVSLDEEELDSF